MARRLPRISESLRQLGALARSGVLDEASTIPPNMVGRIAAISGPGGKSLIVAWATKGATLPNDQIQLARFDCAD